MYGLTAIISSIDRRLIEIWNKHSAETSENK